MKKGKTSGCGVGHLLRFWIVVTDTLDIEDEGDEVVADDVVDLEVGDEGLRVKVCDILDIDDDKCGIITDDIVEPGDGGEAFEGMVREIVADGLESDDSVLK